MSSLTKEINMSVKRLLLQKTDVLKTSKKIWRNTLTLKSKKVQGIFAEMFILALSSSAVFLLQNRVSDFFYFVLIGR